MYHIIIIICLIYSLNRCNIVRAIHRYTLQVVGSMREEMRNWKVGKSTTKRTETAIQMCTNE